MTENALSLPLTDPGLYAHGDPHSLWRELRAKCPVIWNEDPEYGGFWVVTSHSAARQVLQDWRAFSSVNGTTIRRDMSTPFPGGGKMLALADPPKHDVLRRAVWLLFTPRSVAKLEELARSTIRKQLGLAVELGSCDFVGDIAAKIQLEVLAALVGVPVKDMQAIDAMIKAVTEASNEEGITGGNAQFAHLELLAYYWDLLGRRRRSPDHDITSSLALAQANGEIVLTCDNIVVAAGETTKHAMASGLLAMIEHPRQWALLKSGGISFESATEEILRWTSPVTHLLRTAVSDSALGEVPIKAGDPVTVWIPSANRDDDIFDEGGSFSLGRHPNRHLAFGVGVHHCLGAALARLTIRALLEEIVSGSVEITLASQPQRIPSYTLNGLSSLPIECRA
jgi:cytochrome P450